MSLVVDIHKRFAGFSLDVSFSAGQDRVGILGQSGSGKSMTLRCVAGIETPDTGLIEIDGVAAFDSSRGISVRPQSRRAGYLFQNYALFPTMTVAQNLAIASRFSNGTERRAPIDEMIGRFRLEGLRDRYPSQLSGGQQQRVALARMMITRPRLILLDEPLSALDAFLRESVEAELAELLADYPGTVILVSHDRDEIFRMCGRMIVMDGGRVVGSGTRDEVFGDPKTVAAARLTGCKNVAGARKVGARRIAVPAWGLILDTARDVPDGVTHAGVRAHHIRAPLDGDCANCYDFARARRAETPFAALEYIEAITPPEYAGGTRGAREALCREAPREAHCSGGDTEARRDSAQADRVRYCIPPDGILLLR